MTHTLGWYLGVAFYTFLGIGLVGINILFLATDNEPRTKKKCEHTCKCHKPCGA